MPRKPSSAPRTANAYLRSSTGCAASMASAGDSGDRRSQPEMFQPRPNWHFSESGSSGFCSAHGGIPATGKTKNIEAQARRTAVKVKTMAAKGLVVHQGKNSGRLYHHDATVAASDGIGGCNQ